MRVAVSRGEYWMVESQFSWMKVRTAAISGERPFCAPHPASSGSSSAGSGSGHGGGGHAELFLQSVDQLGQLQNGQALDFLDHSSNLLGHFDKPPNCKIFV